MRRTSIWMRIAGVTFVLAILAVVASPTKAQQGGAAAANRTAGEANKNVTTALKDMPADQLVPTMRYFSYSLGVECEFCHVDGDNAKDDKPTKKTAREMIAMEIAINKDNFNARTQVSCNTCHQGANQPRQLTPVESTKIIPGGTPPPAPARGAAPAPAPAPAVETAAPPVLPTADAILAKFTQALGGEAAIRKVTNYTITGVRDTAGRNAQDLPWAQASFEVYMKAPNLRAMVVKTANGQTTGTGFDGASAWTQNANGTVAEASGIALARAKRAADFYEMIDLKQEFTQLRVRPGDKIDGHDTYMLIGMIEGDSPERLFFDQQSGLLLRRVVVNQNVVAASPIQTDYRDYHSIGGGLMFPGTIETYDVMGNPMYTVMHLTKVDTSTPVDPGKLAKPASRAPAGRGGPQ